MSSAILDHTLDVWGPRAYHRNRMTCRQDLPSDILVAQHHDSGCSFHLRSAIQRSISACRNGIFEAIEPTSTPKPIEHSRPKHIPSRRMFLSSTNRPAWAAKNSLQDQSIKTHFNMFHQRFTGVPADTRKRVAHYCNRLSKPSSTRHIWARPNRLSKALASVPVNQA